MSELQTCVHLQTPLQSHNWCYHPHHLSLHILLNHSRKHGSCLRSNRESLDCFMFSVLGSWEHVTRIIFIYFCTSLSRNSNGWCILKRVVLLLMAFPLDIKNGRNPLFGFISSLNRYADFLLKNTTGKNWMIRYKKCNITNGVGVGSINSPWRALTKDIHLNWLQKIPGYMDTYPSVNLSRTWYWGDCMLRVLSFFPLTALVWG